MELTNFTITLLNNLWLFLSGGNILCKIIMFNQEILMIWISTDRSRGKFTEYTNFLLIWCIKLHCCACRKSCRYFFESFLFLKIFFFFLEAALLFFLIIDIFQIFMWIIKQTWFFLSRPFIINSFFALNFFQRWSFCQYFQQLWCWLAFRDFFSEHK